SRAYPFRAPRAPDAPPPRAFVPAQHPLHEPSSRPAAPLLRPRESHLSQTAFASRSPCLTLFLYSMLSDCCTLRVLSSQIESPKRVYVLSTTFARIVP